MTESRKRDFLSAIQQYNCGSGTEESIVVYFSTVSPVDGSLGRRTFASNILYPSLYLTFVSGRTLPYFTSLNSTIERATANSHNVKEKV